MSNRVQTTAVQQDTSSAPHLASVVQRSCACGGSAGMADSCESCQSKDLAGTRVQPKLVVGPVNDPYEQEADRVADHVMRMPDDEVATTSEKDPGSVIQRMCTDCEDEEKVQRKADGEVSAKQTAEIESIKTGGEPLRPSSQNFFEQRFGHDFSNVRIHSDDRAAQSAKDIHALAYTTGHHIVFGAGHYSPDTHAGQKLLAHELTHVVQQAGGASRSVQRKATWVPSKPPNEVINPAQQIAENQIPEAELFFGRTNFLLNGQPFTDASDAEMNKALKKPGFAYADVILELGGSGSGSGEGTGSGSGSGAGSGSGSGSGTKKSTMRGFECSIDSISDNKGTNEVNVMKPDRWTHITEKKNVAGRFPTLKVCKKGTGKVTFRLKGEPDVDTVRDKVKVHERQHDKDNEAIFNDLVVGWDKEITTAKGIIKAKAPSKIVCDKLVYAQATTSKSPEDLVQNLSQRINTKGQDFHKTAAGARMKTKVEQPDSDCNVVNARTGY